MYKKVGITKLNKLQIFLNILQKLRNKFFKWKVCLTMLKVCAILVWKARFPYVCLIKYFHTNNPKIHSLLTIHYQLFITNYSLLTITKIIY
jgi:hypothetical protein